MLFVFLFSSCFLLVVFLFSSCSLLVLFLFCSLAFFLLSSCSLLALFMFSLLSNGSFQWSKVRSQIYEYSDLKIYKDDFEVALIKHTKEYYRNKSAKWISMDTVSTYLAKSVQCLEMERALVQDRLNTTSTQYKLIRACENMILVGPNRDYLTFILSSDTGVGYMLIHDQFDDLRNMHSVLSHIKEQQPMADAMRDHIAAMGVKIIQKRAKEVEQVIAKKKTDSFKISENFINELLDLYRKYNTLITKEFNKDPLLEKALVQAFQLLMKNEPSDHIDKQKYSLIDEKQNVFHVSPNSQMLASNIDHIYRNSNDFDTRDDLELRLSECASLFDFLTDKDNFIAFHTQFLSERLLGKKFNTEEEKFFIGQIKIKQGPQFTNQQETMIADLEKYNGGKNNGDESKNDGMNDFKSKFKNVYLKGESKSIEDNVHAKRWKGDGFNVKLLTSASW